MPFVKGQSGNPAGKPKGAGGLTLTPIIRAELEKIPEGQKESYKTLFVKRLFKKAIVDGDEKALRMIINYVDGLPKQVIEGDLFGDLKITWEK
jgi:hypothetical protein